MSGPSQLPELGLAPASEVTTMAEVRFSIDTIDKAIVILLGQRMRFIEAAARIKPTRDAVRDQWRVDDVLSKVKATAAAVDFPPELAAQVYAVLVEGSIQHEFSNWDKIDSNGAGHTDAKK